MVDRGQGGEVELGFVQVANGEEFLRVLADLPFRLFFGYPKRKNFLAAPFRQIKPSGLWGCFRTPSQ